MLLHRGRQPGIPGKAVQQCPQLIGCRQIPEIETARILRRAPGDGRKGGRPVVEEGFDSHNIVKSVIQADIGGPCYDTRLQG